MGIKLEIPDSQLPSIKDIFKLKADSITTEIRKLMGEYEEILPVLTQLGLQPEFFTPRTKVEPVIVPGYLFGPYKETFTWEQKALYVLNIENNLTPRRIVEILKERFEPELDLEKAYNSLQSTLSVSAKHNKVKRVKNENDDYVYEIENNQ